MTFINPIDYMILKTRSSRAEITEKYGLGKNLLLKATQGRVQSITPRISQALFKEWQEKGLDFDMFDEVYGTLDLDVAYKKWISEARFQDRGSLPVEVENDPSISPFMRLVNAVGSKSRMSQLLRVPDRPIFQYAEGERKTMPETIRVALAEMDYPHLGALEEAQIIWQKGQK